jgi:hypothetical protein
VRFSVGPSVESVDKALVHLANLVEPQTQVGYWRW